MNLKKLLKEQKVVIAGKVEAGTYRVDCPIDYCKTDRAGRDNECLVVEVKETTAHWRCGNCLWSGTVGEKPVVEAAPAIIATDAEKKAATQQSNLPLEAVDYLLSRGLTAQSIEKFKIHFDAERNAIIVPYTEMGKNVNALVIFMDTLESRLASGKRVILYGLDDINPDLPVIIVQDEISRMLLDVCGVHNVLAIPNGGHLPPRPHSDYDAERDPCEYLVPSIELLTRVHRFVLALDNTPQGDEMRKQIGRRIGIAKCYSVDWNSKSLATTFLRSGIDMVCGDVNEALPVPIHGLYEVSNFDNSLLNYFDVGMAAGVSTGWANVDRYYTVMFGELTVVTGVPNNGKSEWVDALTMNLAMDVGMRTVVFSPENAKEQHVTKLVEKRVQMPASPSDEERMSRETFISGATWVGQHYFFIVADDENALPTLDWLLEMAHSAVLRYGVRGFIIDPWNEIEHDRGRDTTETEYISKALSKLKRFARNHDMAIWLIAHPAKMKTDKDGKVVVPSLYDISGSAHWANKADNGIVIQRSEDIRDATEVWVKKVRFKHVGKRGMTTLSYNKKTGRYSEPEGSTARYSATEEEIQTIEAEQ